MKTKPDLAVRIPGKLSDQANSDDSPLEPYRNEDGYLSLDEESNVEEAGPVGLRPMARNFCKQTPIRDGRYLSKGDASVLWRSGTAESRKSTRLRFVLKDVVSKLYFRVNVQ